MNLLSISKDNSSGVQLGIPGYNCFNHAIDHQELEGLSSLYIPPITGITRPAGSIHWGTPEIVHGGMKIHGQHILKPTELLGEDAGYQAVYISFQSIISPLSQASPLLI